MPGRRSSQAASGSPQTRPLPCHPPCPGERLGSSCSQPTSSSDSCLFFLKMYVEPETLSSAGGKPRLPPPPTGLWQQPGHQQDPPGSHQHSPGHPRQSEVRPRPAAQSPEWRSSLPRETKVLAWAEGPHKVGPAPFLPGGPPASSSSTPAPAVRPSPPPGAQHPLHPGCTSPALCG